MQIEIYCMKHGKLGFWTDTRLEAEECPVCSEPARECEVCDMYIDVRLNSCPNCGTDFIEEVI